MLFVMKYEYMSCVMYYEYMSCVFAYVCIFTHAEWMERVLNSTNDAVVLRTCVMCAQVHV